MNKDKGASTHNVIVGTAGHVDHGKTCLIKALTGIDTDRLKEEKKRGITIELGFADMENDRGLNIGIIDVPGHERFVKNMLAGIGGIDLVLLVVAADEGIMPQTTEHFEIIKMLDIKRGIVVITKADLAEEEWLEVVKEDISEQVKGTFLEGAPVIEVSSYTGQNIPQLKELILDMVTDCGQRREAPELFRLPVDRVFTIDGFGTVITGTLVEGSVALGDEIEIYPQGRLAKVRNIQVHGKSSEKASAGQRTAINLANIRKEEIKRGDVLAARGTLKATMMIDVQIDMFKDSPRSLKNGSRLHLYYGSAEALCKAVLLDGDSLESGQRGFAQLRLEEEIAVKKRDRFILRFYSPLETIGGGVILDANPPRRRRFSEETIEGFRIKAEDEGKELLKQVLMEESKRQTPLSQIAGKLGWTAAEAREEGRKLIEEGSAVMPAEDILLHTAYLCEIQERLENILSEYHKKNPVSSGIKKEELRSKFEQAVYVSDNRITMQLIKFFIEKGVIRDEGTTFAAASFKISYSKEQGEMRERILRFHREAGFNAPFVDEVLSGERDKNTAKQMIEQFAKEGLLEKIDYQHYMDREAWDKAVSMMDGYMKENGSMSLGEFRDILGTSRKYAVMLLTAFDERKMTKLEGERRVRL